MRISDWSSDVCSSDLWFITEVMPLLSERLPDVKLRIYGSHPPALLDTLAAETKNVVLEGWVPDVGTAYDNCRVFIAPLQSGAGIKGKVIGAVAQARKSAVEGKSVVVRVDLGGRGIIKKK